MLFFPIRKKMEKSLQSNLFIWLFLYLTFIASHLVSVSIILPQTPSIAFVCTVWDSDWMLKMKLNCEFMDGKSEWHVWYAKRMVRRNHKFVDAFWLLRLVHLPPIYVP